MNLSNYYQALDDRSLWARQGIFRPHYTIFRVGGSHTRRPNRNLLLQQSMFDELHRRRHRHIQPYARTMLSKHRRAIAVTASRYRHAIAKYKRPVSSSLRALFDTFWPNHTECVAGGSQSRGQPKPRSLILCVASLMGYVDAALSP